MISARLIVAMGASFLLLSCNRQVVPETGSTAAAPQTPRRVGRAVYPYSVIPGGVKDRAELESATRNDTAVAEHYSDMVGSSLEPKRLPEDEFAYVSFRHNGRIYWTSHKVRLAAGEMVLANGSVPFVRGRCGNRISVTPKTPVVPPEIQEPPPEMLMTPVPASGIPYDVAVTLSPAPSGDPVAEPGSRPLVPIAKFSGSVTEPDVAAGFGPGPMSTDSGGGLPAVLPHVPEETDVGSTASPPIPGYVPPVIGIVDGGSGSGPTAGTVPPRGQSPDSPPVTNFPLPPEQTPPTPGPTEVPGTPNVPGTDSHHINNHNADPQDESGSPVPEPSCLVLVAIGALTCTWYRCVRSRYQ